MKCLYDEILYGREFGRAAARVVDLQAWASDGAAGLPPTRPEVSGYDVVQLEALLQAIQVAATPDEPAGNKHEVRWGEIRIMEGAKSLPAITDPVLGQLREIMSDPGRTDEGPDVATARFLIGAHAHHRWRERIRQGVKDRAFQVVDCVDLMPVEQPAATGNAAGASGAALTTGARGVWPEPITKHMVAAAFDGLHYNDWRKRLADPKGWLKDAVVQRGIRGRGGMASTWDPVKIGAGLVRNGVEPRSVRARFQSREALKPWLDAWKTYEADHFET